LSTEASAKVEDARKKVQFNNKAGSEMGRLFFWKGGVGERGSGGVGEREKRRKEIGKWVRIFVFLSVSLY